jgi:LAO/AO transport system kinase
MPNPEDHTTPSVKAGIPQPASLNPDWTPKARRLPSKVEEYIAGIQRGDRVVLSQAVTLIESKQTQHRALAHAIIEACLPLSGKSIRIGITGVPGVGKSTFIEALGQTLSANGNKLAVLAIDPSSQLSRGSILGDKTRMAKLALDPQVYIRPSAAGDSLGGVARKTRETIILCEAAGFDTLIIETVGVGQSEVAVHSMVDFFLLLLLPGAGDELQGIKRGIVEMADLVAVNKAEGDNLQRAKRAAADYRNALHLFPPKTNNWTSQVLTCSALSGQGIKEVWELILEYQRFTTKSGFFQQQRQNQARYWLREAIGQYLFEQFYHHPSVANLLSELESQVLTQQLSPFHAAEDLVQAFLGKKK